MVYYLRGGVHHIKYYYKKPLVNIIKYVSLLLMVILCSLVSISVAEPDKESKRILPDNFYYAPIPEILEDVSKVTSLSSKEILHAIENNFTTESFTTPTPLPNEYLIRLYQFLISYNDMSKMRFNRGVQKLYCQMAFQGLIKHLMKTRWYHEFLILVSNNSSYGYSEDQALRIVISIHTAAHFFQIPFPTLFCLIFQESKFDFKAQSFSGALGLGQLTKIALRQVNKIRKRNSEERRLMAASIHLSNIYKDPVINEVLTKMGFKPSFPNLGKFPAKIIKKTPLNKYIIRKVGKVLVSKGYSYGKNYKTVKSKIKQLLRGGVLAGKYASIHPILAEVTDDYYGKKYGNILNVETNILLSAMILRYYIVYPWKINGERLNLDPSLRAILAITAYNQGETPVLLFLKQLRQQYPNINIEKVTPKDLAPLFTKKLISKALKKSSNRTLEVYKHVRKMRNCSEKNVTRSWEDSDH